MEQTPQRLRLDLSNSSHRTLTVYIEPWGDRAELQPDGTFSVEAVGPDSGSLEFVWGNDDVTIYGWSGSTLLVSSDGGKVVGDYRIPAPPLPGCPEEDVAAYQKLLKSIEREGTH